MVFYLKFCFLSGVSLQIIAQCADEIKLYISLDPDNELICSSSLTNLEHCIADIRLWMTQNLLKLNDNKTNNIYLASPHCVKSIRTPALHMGASSITPNGSVKHLRVILDQCINVYEHITSVCRAAYYHLKNIHCLKAFLTQESLVTVVHVFITSRIDYYMAYLIITLITFSEFRIAQIVL